MLDIIQKLKDGQSLSRDKMADVMDCITEGEVSEDDIVAFLSALAEKGETADELAGAADTLRRKALQIRAPSDALDCCGTGGDAKGTYNISTAVSLVVAACGVPVAKHGNRASSSKSGTADVLEAMGVNLNLPAAALEEALQEFGFAFLMAPQHHRAMKHVAEARKKIGKRTIFNLLGPLLNPAGASYQLLGVFDKKWLIPMANALFDLGSEKAWIVHGQDGLDEITLTTSTDIVTLDKNGVIEEHVVGPDDFGLPTYALEDLQGGDATENAKALRSLLEGQKGAYRDIVLANAAAALRIAEKAENLQQGVHIAGNIIDDGLADQLLRDYIQFSRQYIDSYA